MSKRVIPAIRISTFSDAWEQRKLSEYLDVSNEKNTEEVFTKQDVLSVSGDFGIVNQIEFQGRSFAGASVSEYGVVYTGDIVYTNPSLTAKKRRELINKGFLRFLNWPKRSYILLLFLGFPYYSFHADIRQDLIIRSKTCHLMKPVGKVCPGIGRQISLLFTRPVHVH